MGAMAAFNAKRIEWGVFFTLVVGISILIGLNVRRLGFRFESQPEMELDYVMGVLWWSVLAVAIAVFARLHRRMLLLAWVGKFFVVLVLMLIYEYSYGLDAISYHTTTKTGYYEYVYPGIDFRRDMIPSLKPVTDEFGDPMGGLGTENFIRILLLIASVTGPFFHAIKVVFAFLGLLGVWWFYQGVTVALGRPYPPAFYLLAFFPSIIFWSSIFGKDPLQFFFLGVYAYGVAVLLTQERLVSLWPLGVGIIGSFMIRPWTAYMMIGALLLARLVQNLRAWVVGFALLAVAAGALIRFSGLYYGGLEGGMIGDPEMIYELVRSVQLAQAQGGGSGGELLSEEGSLGASIPAIIFSGLFRPLPFDITNPFTALAAIENSIVLGLTLAALYRIRLAFLRDPLLLWMGLYSLMWAALYGFIVMANFGAGARYKLQVWPFLLLTLLLLTHREGRALLLSRTVDRKTRNVSVGEPILSLQRDSV